MSASHISMRSTIIMKKKTVFLIALVFSLFPIERIQFPTSQLSSQLRFASHGNSIFFCFVFILIEYIVRLWWFRIETNKITNANICFLLNATVLSRKHSNHIVSCDSLSKLILERHLSRHAKNHKKKKSNTLQIYLLALHLKTYNATSFRAETFWRLDFIGGKVHFKSSASRLRSVWRMYVSEWIK